MRALQHLIIFSVFLGLALSYCQEGVAAENNGPGESFRTAACYEQLASTIEQWKVTPQWHKQISESPGEEIYASPTADVGMWVFVRLDPQGQLQAMKTSDSEKIIVSWTDANCQADAKVSRRKNNNSSDKYFSDQDLRDLIKQNPKGIIYAWTPKMHFSEEGIKDIKAVAEKLGLPLTIVVEPNLSNKKYRSLSSFDLEMRGMTIHYPSVIVYNSGKLSPVLPGADSIEGYSRFIEKYL